MFYATDASNDISRYLTGPNAGGERYKWWFGEWDAPNARAHPSTPDELVRQKVIGAFQTMKMRKFESSRYDYNCDCDQNINSFVYPTRCVCFVFLLFLLISK